MEGEQLERQEVDLSELVRAVTTDLGQSDPGRQVEFNIADDVIGNGDPRRLRVALDNLLSNAWKFTGKQPRAKIEFGVAQRDGERAYYVRDNGVGFDMTDSDRLFTPFDTLHPDDQFEGTGIGLATLERIIQNHGGRVWAEGAVGKGATFYFTLGEE